MFNNVVFEFIKKYGITSVILGGLIEQVVVPIPSPLVPMAAGFLFVTKQVFSLAVFKEIFLKAAFPFAVGSTIGSTMVYLIAWHGGKWLIDRFSKWFSFNWADVERFHQQYFKGKATDELLIFVFRAIPLIPSVLISAVCGAVRIRAFDYYFFTFLGLLVRGMLLGFVGWQSEEALFKIAGGLDKWESALGGVILLLILSGLFWAYKGRERWLKRMGIG